MLFTGNQDVGIHGRRNRLYHVGVRSCNKLSSVCFFPWVYREPVRATSNVEAMDVPECCGAGCLNVAGKRIESSDQTAKGKVLTNQPFAVGGTKLRPSFLLNFLELELHLQPPPARKHITSPVRLCLRAVYESRRSSLIATNVACSTSLCAQ
jgi:hypothetical protein